MNEFSFHWGITIYDQKLSYPRIIIQDVLDLFHCITCITYSSNGNDQTHFALFKLISCCFKFQNTKRWKDKECHWTNASIC